MSNYYTSDTYKTFVDLPANEYSFKVRTVSPKGNVSEWVSVDYTSDYEGPLESSGDYTHGISKWVTSSSKGEIVRETTTVASEKYSLTSPQFYVNQYEVTDSQGQTVTYYSYKWNDVVIYQGSDPSLAIGPDGTKYEKGATQINYNHLGAVSWSAIKSTANTGAQGDEVFKFETYPVDIAAATNPGNFVTISSASPNGKVDLSGVTDDDPRELYIVFDESVPRVFLGEWDTNANTDQSPPFWRDANEPMSHAWTALTATSAQIAANTNKLIGVGTNFTTEVQLGSIVSLANQSSQGETLGDAAVVTSIESDTALTLDRTFSSTLNLSYLYVNSFYPDKDKDAIVATITRPT